MFVLEAALSMPPLVVSIQKDVRAVAQSVFEFLTRLWSKDRTKLRAGKETLPSVVRGSSRDDCGFLSFC